MARNTLGGFFFLIFFFPLENISLPQAAVTANIPAGAGVGRHHPAGWLGLPALPFPSQGAIPRDLHKSLFMLPAPGEGFVFPRGEKRSWRGPPGISRGALAAPRALSSPGKREDC